MHDAVDSSSASADASHVVNNAIMPILDDTASYFFSPLTTPSGSERATATSSGLEERSWDADRESLFSAVSEGRLDVVCTKLRGGADPSEKDAGGDRCALHAATLPWPERLDIARALVAAKADVNAVTTSNGDSALVQCCRADDAALAQVLLDCGADVNLRDRSRGGGQAPLIICATLPSLLVLDVLLAAPGLDRSVRFLQSTALELARSGNHHEAAQRLLAAAPLPRPPSDPAAGVSVRVTSLTERSSAFDLRWGSTVAELLRLHLEAVGEAGREGGSFYFEVEDGVREPPQSLSAHEIPGYRRVWPAAIRRARLKLARADETLAGLAVSGSSPLHAWWVVDERALVEEVEVTVQDAPTRRCRGCSRAACAVM